MWKKQVIKTKIKTAKTTKEYHVKNYHGGSSIGHGSITVPIGSMVTNMTACGPDDNYHFWKDFHKIAKEISGFDNSILSHDLTYYGLDIPAEYCEPWK